MELWPIGSADVRDTKMGFETRRLVHTLDAHAIRHRFFLSVEDLRRQIL
jgi:hypothetical protein